MSTWQERYNEWKDFDKLDLTMKEQLTLMKDDAATLEDAFYTELSFGTGGIRGILGAGTNRLNIYTVRKAMKGLALYLEENSVNVKDRGIVIAYDSRHQSREFALEAAKVFGVHGIRTYIFEELRPTPLLSYAVRYLSTVAGIMITASHNPPEYNGLKVYNEEGSQLGLDDANAVIESIKTVANPLEIPVMDEATLEENNLVEWMNGQVDNAYIEQLLTMTKLSEAEVKEEKDLNIVFTPLHGTALPLVEAGLKQLSFQHVHIVEEQAVPDPEFSTVDLPNPEERQAFAYAIDLGNQVNADILLATDPDADRLGVAVRNDQGQYEILTGNQLGSLLLDYVLSQSNEAALQNGRMIKTIVTTELGRAIASSYGVETLDTLTGFKYIGEKINEYDKTGESFLFGYEESYGYLISSFARDKDAVQSSVMTCEMAQYWKNKNMTLLDALNNLYEKHGFYREALQSITLKGIQGQKQIKEMIDYLRHTSIKEINGIKVQFKEDYLLGKRINKVEDSEETIRLPEENVLKYILADGSWVCARPSGTEPKIKFYYGVRKESAAEAERAVNELYAAVNELLQLNE
ncbi:MAG TPA: phospho-sugar mutase [Pseudogracilibacillus sp.]|nr:phospho-sugar mutase [Pseudogracilibacillus sp.]